MGRLVRLESHQHVSHDVLHRIPRDLVCVECLDHLLSDDASPHDPPSSAGISGDPREFSGRVPVHPDPCPEHPVDQLFGQDLGRRADGHKIAKQQDRDPVAVGRGEIEVVGDRHDGDAGIPVQRPDQVKHIDLMGDVEVGVGFVQEDHRRFLRERPGNERPLAFPAGEASHGLVGKTEDVGEFHGPTGDRAVLIALEEATPHMRRAAHEHHFVYGEGKERAGVLGHESDAAGQRRPAVGAHRLPLQGDPPVRRDEDPVEKRKRVVLPDPFGPTMLRNSPCSTSKETFRRTGVARS